MSHTIQFPEPQRVAIQHEVFDDSGDIETSQWVEERDTVTATEITHTESVIAISNSETGECMLVSTENFISAWTGGAGE